jgi:hypothetical protein
MKVIGEGDALLAYRNALGAVESVSKSETADMGKYVIKYASLNAVHAECVRACEVFKLAVSQEPTIHEGLFAVVNTLIHEDGSRLEFEPMCLPLPKEAQALGSATTYLRRYSLVAQFGLAVEDDDGRAATVAAQTQPGRRTEAERMIREAMATMTPERRAEFAADFKTEFRSTLADLPASQHGRALTWAREWQAGQETAALDAQVAEDAADAAFIAEAQTDALRGGT